ncbi:hypothetical protein SAMN06272775_4381 [Streptomyces sp. 2323.1]|nr:hypothetical protein SAMN06272775_4381 [Streptomyces sp. 2323.1]
MTPRLGMGPGPSWTGAPRRSGPVQGVGTPGASTPTYWHPPTTPCGSTSVRCAGGGPGALPVAVRAPRRRRMSQEPVAGVRHRPDAEGRAAVGRRGRAAELVPRALRPLARRPRPPADRLGRNPGGRPPLRAGAARTVPGAGRARPGPQVNAWAEVMDSQQRLAHQDFTRRMAVHYARPDALGVDHRPPGGPLPGRNGPESSDARSTGRPQTCEPRCKEGARKAGPWDGGAVRRSPRTCRTEHRMCRRARPAAPFRAPPPTRHTAVPVPSVADETGREPCPGTDRRFVDPRAEGPGRCARVATSGL